VQDDILQVILNLKELAVVSHSDEIQILKINVKGQKGKATVVTARDIEVTGETEIKNIDHVITNLADEKSSLKAEIYVANGVGYSLSDESLRKDIGMIPVDSIFSPIRRVSFKIVPARVGQITDLDKIVLEMYSKGTVLGSEALLKAAEIYDEMANRLVNQLGGDSQLAEEELQKEVEEKKEEKPKILVSELGLSTRLTNSLLNAGITDLHELHGRSLDEILEFKGMGKKSLDELGDIMKDHNLSLGE
jgi:DNA-directed RNA polymerase subunit alpha